MKSLKNNWKFTHYSYQILKQALLCSGVLALLTSGSPGFAHEVDLPEEGLLAVRGKIRALTHDDPYFNQAIARTVALGVCQRQTCETMPCNSVEEIQFAVSSQTPVKGFRDLIFSKISCDHRPIQLPVVQMKTLPSILSGETHPTQDFLERREQILFSKNAAQRTLNGIRLGWRDFLGDRSNSVFRPNRLMTNRDSAELFWLYQQPEYKNPSIPSLEQIEASLDAKDQSSSPFRRKLYERLWVFFKKRVYRVNQKRSPQENELSAQQIYEDYNRAIQIQTEANRELAILDRMIEVHQMIKKEAARLSRKSGVKLDRVSSTRCRALDDCRTRDVNAAVLRSLQRHGLRLLEHDLPSW